MLKFWKTSTNAIIKLMRIYFLRELFSQDNNSKRCDECQIQFKNCRQKKIKHNFLFHGNQQTGGSMNQQGEVLRGDQ